MNSCVRSFHNLSFLFNKNIYANSFKNMQNSNKASHVAAVQSYTHNCDTWDKYPTSLTNKPPQVLYRVDASALGSFLVFFWTLLIRHKKQAIINESILFSFFFFRKKEISSFAVAVPNRNLWAISIFLIKHMIKRQCVQ